MVNIHISCYFRGWIIEMQSTRSNVSFNNIVFVCACYVSIEP